jgi:hypothetical protein
MIKQKVLKILMKLELLVDGSLELKRVFLSFYVETFGHRGNR